jgi:hypothetical protein
MHSWKKLILIFVVGILIGTTASYSNPKIVFVGHPTTKPTIIKHVK